MGQRGNDKAPSALEVFLAHLVMLAILFMASQGLVFLLREICR